MPEKNIPLLSSKEQKWLQENVPQGQPVLSAVKLLISLMRDERISLDQAYQQGLEETKSNSKLNLHENLNTAYEFLNSETGKKFTLVDPSRDRK